MLKSVKNLRGYTIQATDGEIGKVHEFYFDDKLWEIRYLVVDTGGWFSGRRVLISPTALGQPDWKQEIFPVSLTKEQVENSPDTDMEKPISRQYESKLYQYYNWPIYWGEPAYIDAETAAKLRAKALTAAEKAKVAEEAEEEEDKGSSHLRSTGEVIGYNIQANDGEIGHVEDFIVDDETWIIRYMVIDTRDWLPGKKVLVASQWIENVTWAESKVYVELSRESIKNSPEFDPSAPVNREYEEKLYDYYGRPKYWA